MRWVALHAISCITHVLWPDIYYVVVLVRMPAPAPYNGVALGRVHHDMLGNLETATLVFSLFQGHSIRSSHAVFRERLLNRSTDTHIGRLARHGLDEVRFLRRIAAAEAVRTQDWYSII